SVRGLISPLTELAPAAAPSLSPSALAQLARHALTPSYPHAAQWTITDRGTYWTSSNPWQPGRLHHTRALEVSEPAGHRAEMVYVETTTGRIILRYPLHCSLDRRLYQSRISGANRIWVEGNAFPGNLDAEEQEMLQTSKEVYHFFQRTFDRNSFDGQNGQMRQVVDVIFRGDSLNGGCPNARASNGAIYHCNGVVSDDVVAHEWTHNYMAAINGIIYQFESGAISEGYADIFGEVVDLLNTRGGDTGDHLPRTSCNDPGLRWRLGEDIVAIDTFIRDLWLPECRDDPSSRSSANYACFDLDQDDGGVHVNSGLVNRTFTLLVDGGVLRGDTVVGIGLTKAVHLFFHAADKYFSPVTDFNALGMMLRQSAHDLAGTPLSELTLLDLPTSFSQDTITSFDSLQLERAMRATGLEEPSPCPTVDNLA
ncbi:MAG: M4 family metallopeptidase, partial [Bacteroidota bacterium]